MRDTRLIADMAGSKIFAITALLFRVDVKVLVTKAYAFNRQNKHSVWVIHSGYNGFYGRSNLRRLVTTTLCPQRALYPSSPRPKHAILIHTTPLIVFRQSTHITDPESW